MRIFRGLGPFVICTALAAGACSPGRTPCPPCPATQVTAPTSSGAPFGPQRLSQIVRKRGRALSLTVDGADWVAPNDHVDILALLPRKAGGEPVAVTLVQNVIVVSIDCRTGSSPKPPGLACQGGPQRLTFMLLPEETEQVLLAKRLGELYLTLRNPEDISSTDPHRQTTSTGLVPLEKAE